MTERPLRAVSPQHGLLEMARWVSGTHEQRQAPQSGWTVRKQVCGAPFRGGGGTLTFSV